MGTIREIIERVNENNPNAYSENTLVGWIGQLDGKIGLNVMLMNAAEMQQFRYRYPEAMDYEPLVAFPHDDLYDLWLNVKIHGENGETERYQNALVLYNAAYRDYVRWFASTYAPAQDESTAVTYYITAYGLAVQQGYGGSLDEWLASLKGEKGDTGKSAYEYALEGGFVGSEELYREQIANSGKSAYEYAVEGGYEGTPEEFAKKLANDEAMDAVKKHCDDENNPHNVTAVQVGAVPGACAKWLPQNGMSMLTFPSGFTAYSVNPGNMIAEGSPEGFSEYATVAAFKLAEYAWYEYTDVFGNKAVWNTNGGGWQRMYSTNHKPSAADIGAVTSAQVTTMINDALGVIENGTY